MRFRRSPSALFFLAALAACGESTGVENVSRIELTPASPAVDVGLSIQFTARAFDVNGNVLSNVPFSWSSSDSAVASVDTNGLATGNRVGSTAITASAGSATPASQVLVVDPSKCLDRVTVVLDPGQFQSYDGDQCLLLPTGDIGDRYRIAITRPTLIEDPADVPDVWLEINPVATAAESPDAEAPAPAPAPTTYSASPSMAAAGPLLDGTRFVEDRGVMRRTRAFHAELRSREQSPELRDRPVLPNRAGERAARAGGPALVDPPARDDLFLVIACEVGALRSPVKLIDFNDDVAIYQDSVQNTTDPLDPAATTRMLDYFADYVRDLMPQYWGPTPDIDGNGRVLITTSTALPDSAAAAVFSGDFRSTIDCASSNEGEVVYFSEDVINSMEETNPSYLALSVMAHEVKHVTSLYHSLARGAFHSLWIEEGTAEIAQTMSSRVAWAATGGPPIGAVIEGDEIIAAVQATGGQVSPEMWGIISELADLIATASTQPNSLITNPAGAAQFHTFYTTSWHWHRFIGDAYGNATTPFADGALFVEMTDSLTPAGPAAHAAVTGRSFEQLFEEVVVAMSLHDAGPVPVKAFTTWELASSTDIFASPPEVAPPGLYPWPVTMALNGNPSRGFTAGVYSCPPKIVGGSYQLASPSDRCPIGPAGVRLHDFVSGGSGAGAQVLVVGAPSGKLVVTRLR